MKILSWNVNGIRAAQRNGLLRYLDERDADVVCLQEIKARPEQLDEDLKNPKPYTSFWYPAKRPGYSGVALLTRKEPDEVAHGIGVEAFDDEGRVLTASFGDLRIVNAYFPNTRPDHSRLAFKLEFCAAVSKHCWKLRKKGLSVVLCGDFNVAHMPIDLARPKENETSAGFLPEERAWMDSFTSEGWIDGFRLFEKGPGHYTWWTYRAGARARNIGWRIDYFCVNPEAAERVESVLHHPDIPGSDHCPLSLTLR